MIRFGPAGLGPVKNAIQTLEEYTKHGIKACEIAFTYGVYIKSKKDAEEIERKARELDIKLSIHAPYWINLNSIEKAKIEQSKKRLLRCMEVGTWLGACRVVFHPGFYGKIDKKTTYENIKKEILELENERKRRGFTAKLAPETMGKINVFGSLDETLQLVKEIGCSFCIDFAHLLAREKKVDYSAVFKQLADFKEIHIHFSGIDYGEKGERFHLLTPDKSIKSLIKSLPQNKELIIINESPDPVGDTVKSIAQFNKFISRR
jgi:deoxyribonuclease-4